MVSTKPIERGEELLVAYGQEYWAPHAPVMDHSTIDRTLVIQRGMKIKNDLDRLSEEFGMAKEGLMHQPDQREMIDEWIAGRQDDRPAL